MLENKFQAELIEELKELFPGCVVLKNDSGYLQGFPDLTILYNDEWAVLEVKKSFHEPYRPNQEWYLDKLNEMSFATMICPENKDEVLDAIFHTFRSRRTTRVSKRK